MLSSKSALSALSLTLLSLPAAAQAPELAAPAWTVERDQSRLGFSGLSDGEAFAGKFEEWAAEIRFDPANLSASSADVTIAMGSVDTEDPNKASSLVGGDWFAVDMFPDAVFRTTSIRKAGDEYVAEGTLRIRDMSQTVSLPFSLDIEGDVARMKGELTLDRRNFGLGGGWQDSHVDPEVTVEVNVVARKAG